MPNLYDIDASGTDVKCVLEALARRSGANIVVSPDITGSINAHLKQMTVDSILDYLSTVDGFKWQKSGSTYLVANKDRFVAPPAPVEAPPPAPDQYADLGVQIRESGGPCGYCHEGLPEHQDR